MHWPYHAGIWRQVTRKRAYGGSAAAAHATVPTLEARGSEARTGEISGDSSTHDQQPRSSKAGASTESQCNAPLGEDAAQGDALALLRGDMCEGAAAGSSHELVEQAGIAISEKVVTHKGEGEVLALLRGNAAEGTAVAARTEMEERTRRRCTHTRSCVKQ